MAKKNTNNTSTNPPQDWQWLPVEKYVDGKLQTVYVKARKVGYPQSRWEAVEYDANGNYRAYASASDAKGVKRWEVNNNRAYDAPKSTTVRTTNKSNNTRATNKSSNTTPAPTIYNLPSREELADMSGIPPEEMNEILDQIERENNNVVPEGWHETAGVLFPDSYTKEEEDEVLNLHYNPQNVQQYRFDQNYGQARIPTHGGGFTTQRYIDKYPDAYQFGGDDPSILGAKDPLFVTLTGGRALSNGALKGSWELGKDAFNLGKNKLIQGIGEDAWASNVADLKNIWNVAKYPVYTGFGIQGANSLASDHGLRRTWDLGKKTFNEDWRYAFPLLGSAFGDALDLSFMVPSTKLYGNLYRNLGNKAIDTGLDVATKLGNTNAAGIRVAREMNRAFKPLEAVESLGFTAPASQVRNVLGKSNITEPAISYDANGNLVTNPNFFYRRGWGIIDDAVDTGRVRVPEGDYKKAALQKYPWLDNGNPFSTTLMNHKFPYFSNGELWPSGAKFGKVPDDLIAIPNDISGVEWRAGTKWGTLKPDVAPEPFGGRATPLINGQTNMFPTEKALLYRRNPTTGKYELYTPPESGPKTYDFGIDTVEFFPRRLKTWGKGLLPDNYAETIAKQNAEAMRARAAARKAGEAVQGTTKAQGGPLVQAANMFRNGGPKRKRNKKTNTTPPTGLTPWPALNNIQYEAIADPEFTREKTGAGDIEVMFNDTPSEGYVYGNGYTYPHPKPGNNVIIYNPASNDEQDIRLDALHIMPQDPTYDVLRSRLAYYGDDSDLAWNARGKMKDDMEKYGHLINTPEQYYQNEVDGFLRNMFIEGTPEYIESKGYYPNKQELRTWNAPLMPYVDAIQQYLETNEKPSYVLDEVVVPGNKHEEGGQLETPKKWSDLSIKEKADMMKVAIRNGITDLSSIKDKYNEFAKGGNLYGDGSQIKIGWKPNASGKSWKDQHYMRWLKFLRGKGLNDNDAGRLAYFFTAQDGLESAGGTSSAARDKNNFGGMQRGGKNIYYPSPEAYMEDKWKMMNSKFKSALGAQTIDEYATILGNPKTAGKGYLYYVTDAMKYDPSNPKWQVAQTEHMQNYINGMRHWAGQKPMLVEHALNVDVSEYFPKETQQSYTFDPQVYEMSLKNKEQMDKNAEALARMDAWIDNYKQKKAQEADLAQKAKARDAVRKNQANALAFAVNLIDANRQGENRDFMAMAAPLFNMAAHGSNLYYGGGPTLGWNANDYTSKWNRPVTVSQVNNTARKRSGGIGKSVPSNHEFYKILPQLFARDGVSIRITSGYRPGAVTSRGLPSRHATEGSAADIAPINKSTFDDILRVLDDPNSYTSKWLVANGYGYLNETIPEVMRKTGATGPHFHIGMDSNLASSYAQRMGAKYNPNVTPNYQLDFPNDNVNALVLDENILAQNEALNRQNEEIARLNAQWENLMAQENAAREAKNAKMRDSQMNLGKNLALGILSNMGNNGQSQGNFMANVVSPIINSAIGNNLDSNTAAYGGNLYDGETNPTGQMTTSQPVYTNKVRQRPDGSYYYIDEYDNQWPMFEIGDNRYATYDTEGKVKSMFNLNPAAVEAVKPSWAYGNLTPQQAYEKDLAKTTVKDLDRNFADMLTFGYGSAAQQAAEDWKKGKYLQSAIGFGSPLFWESGPLGNAYRAAFGIYHLANEEGVPKTYREFMAGNYGNAAKSLAGDAFNALIATHGVKGLYGDALWGMSDYGTNAMRNFARPRIIVNAFNEDIANTTLKAGNPFNQRYITSWGVGNDREYTLYDDLGRVIGEGNTSTSVTNPNRAEIAWIQNLSGNQTGARVNGVSEDIYNTMVAQNLRRGGEGVESGARLLNPKATQHITSKFPHTVIGRGNEGATELRVLTGTSNKLLPMEVDKMSNHFRKIGNKKATDQSSTISWEEATSQPTVAETIARQNAEAMRAGQVADGASKRGSFFSREMQQASNNPHGAYSPTSTGAYVPVPSVGSYSKDLQDMILEMGEQEVLDYVGSDRHILRIMEGGKSEEEAKEIAGQMRQNVMKAVGKGRIGKLPSRVGGQYNVTGAIPEDSTFKTIIKALKGFAGHFDPVYTINEDSKAAEAIEDLVHEVGGHGATLGYMTAEGEKDPIKAFLKKAIKRAIDKNFPKGKDVYEHNATLKPVRKPEYMNSDNPYIKYLEDVDEYSARARTENIKPSSEGMDALYKYFTKESVDKLVNNVWGALPWVVGAGTAGTAYGLSNNDEVQ